MQDTRWSKTDFTAKLRWKVYSLFWGNRENIFFYIYRLFKRVQLLCFHRNKWISIFLNRNYICLELKSSRTSSWLPFTFFTFQSGIRSRTRMPDRKFSRQFLSVGVWATNEFPGNTDRRRNWEYQQGRPCQRHVLLFRDHALNTFVLRILGSVFQLQIVSNDLRMDWTYFGSLPRLLAFSYFILHMCAFCQQLLSLSNAMPNFFSYTCWDEVDLN